MKIISKSRVCMAAVVGLLMACSSTKKDVALAPSSDDLLELLTGFGESLSKRNFNKAVDYMVPEEKALMMEGGSVPSDKQKMLLALPLQKLIRHPAIRVENGHIAGIYSVLPNLRQGDAVAVGSDDTSASPDYADFGSDASAADSKGPLGTGSLTASGSDDATVETDAPIADAADPKLKETVNKFFTAVNKKNWNNALAMMNEDERKFLLDDKGRLKESAKQRLSKIDQQNREALTMQDGKLTGVTLLLPSDN